MRWLSKFHLSVTERKGFIALLVLLFIVIGIRFGLVFWSPRQAGNQSTLLQEIEVWREERRLAMLVARAFNPNLVSDSTINTFKISTYSKNNWMNARKRGRQFKTKDDVLAIYGMDTAWFLVNYDSILIADPGHSEMEKTVAKFTFDPNTATRENFIALGIPVYLAERIVKYRTSGGVFKSPEDLKRIYGFPEALFLELKPFIRITKQAEVKEEPIPAKETRIESINLNQCDSTQLLTLPGIGPTFASRILKYRHQLGGFYKPEQLLEVYGFDEARLAKITPYIRIGVNQIKKLSVNQATFKELLAHPYLNYEQVKTLVNYREKVGPFKNINGLAQLEHFSAKDVERLSPYLSVE